MIFDNLMYICIWFLIELNNLFVKLRSLYEISKDKNLLIIIVHS